MPEAGIAAALACAKTRLDTLDYYPEPVRVDRVRIRVAPWFFRIPGFRRYHGYAFWRTILLRSATCRTISRTSSATSGKGSTAPCTWREARDHAVQVEPYEIEARRAVDETGRPTAQPGL